MVRAARSATSSTRLSYPPGWSTVDSSTASVPPEQRIVTTAVSMLHGSAGLASSRSLPSALTSTTSCPVIQRTKSKSWTEE